MTQADIDLICARVGFPKGEVIPVPCGNCESLRGAMMHVVYVRVGKHNLPRPGGKRHEDCIFLEGRVVSDISKFQEDHNMGECDSIYVFASLEGNFFPSVSFGSPPCSGYQSVDSGLVGTRGIIVFTSPEYVIIENPSLDVVRENLLKAKELERETIAKREHINLAVAQWHAARRKDVVL